MANEENKNGKFSSIWQKASDMGKKAADGIQKGVKDLSDKAKEEIHEQRMKKYNPLSPKEYKSKSFSLAKIIRIISDEELRAIDVCEGAIGWRDRSGDTEILYLSYGYVKSSGIEFFPSVSLNEVYCVDPFENSRYVHVDAIFGKAHEERLAELEHIAFSLGAKSCAIEIVEGESVSNDDKKAMGTKIISAKSSSRVSTSNSKRGRTETSFEGNDNPKRPELKWFKNDKNILALIDMRCSAKNSIKSRYLTLEGSTSATMSKNLAISIDKISNIKPSVSMESKATKEHNSTLIFEVEF